MTFVKYMPIRTAEIDRLVVTDSIDILLLPLLAKVALGGARSGVATPP